MGGCVGVKKPWLSKTLWVNLVLAVLAFVPAAQEMMKESPEMVVVGVNMINMLLRMITKDKVTLVDEKTA